MVFTLKNDCLINTLGVTMHKALVFSEELEHAPNF